MDQQNELESKKYKCENASAEGLLSKVNDKYDPVFLAQLMYSLKEERERTNSLIATVIHKVEALEMKIEEMEKGRAKEEGIMLGEVDSELLKYVKKKRVVCAEEVQEHFKYKGKNGASSRLHRLFSLGYLKKTYAGRKVYYSIK
ncbi:MAG: hypothetical protein ACP5H8_01020 [Candidatus Micrarchaeia archaeon]